MGNLKALLQELDEATGLNCKGQFLHVSGGRTCVGAWDTEVTRETLVKILVLVLTLTKTTVLVLFLAKITPRTER